MRFQAKIAAAKFLGHPFFFLKKRTHIYVYTDIEAKSGNKKKGKGGKGKESEEDSEEVDEEEEDEDTMDANEGESREAHESDHDEEDERDAILPSDIRNHLVQPRKGKKQAAPPARAPSRAAAAAPESAGVAFSQSQVPGTPLSQALASSAADLGGEERSSQPSKSQGRRSSGGTLFHIFSLFVLFF